jgi:Fur family ferric uptake transcriptional regulator
MTLYTQQFAEFLQTKGQRLSKSRTLIAGLFERAGGHSSIKELYEDACALDRGLGMATVYRTVRLLMDAGLADEVHFGDGVTRYEPRRNGGGHAHFVCERCGRRFEIPERRLLSALERCCAGDEIVAVTSHKLLLSGICSACEQKRDRAPVSRRLRRRSEPETTLSGEASLTPNRQMRREIAREGL